MLSSVARGNSSPLVDAPVGVLGSREEMAWFVQWPEMAIHVIGFDISHP